MEWFRGEQLDRSKSPQRRKRKFSFFIKRPKAFWWANFWAAQSNWSSPFLYYAKAAVCAYYWKQQRRNVPQYNQAVFSKLTFGFASAGLNRSTYQGSCKYVHVNSFLVTWTMYEIRLRQNIKRWDYFLSRISRKFTSRTTKIIKM